jgi:hypothetical protein
MQLLICLPRNKTLVAELDESKLVNDLKQLIEDREGVPLHACRLWHKYRQLHGAHTLERAKLSHGDTLRMTISNASNKPTVKFSASLSGGGEKIDVRLWPGPLFVDQDLSRVVKLTSHSTSNDPGTYVFHHYKLLTRVLNVQSNDLVVTYQADDEVLREYLHPGTEIRVAVDPSWLGASFPLLVGEPVVRFKLLERNPIACQCEHDNAARLFVLQRNSSNLLDELRQCIARTWSCDVQDIAEICVAQTPYSRLPVTSAVSIRRWETEDVDQSFHLTVRFNRADEPMGLLPPHIPHSAACHICTSDFDSTSHRPCALSCGHLLCEECSTKVQQKCPVCRALFAPTKPSVHLMECQQELTRASCRINLSLPSLPQAATRNPSLTIRFETSHGRLCHPPVILAIVLEMHCGTNPMRLTFLPHAFMHVYGPDRQLVPGEYEFVYSDTAQPAALRFTPTPQLQAERRTRDTWRVLLHQEALTGLVVMPPADSLVCVLPAPARQYIPVLLQMSTCGNGMTSITTLLLHQHASDALSELRRLVLDATRMSKLDQIHSLDVSGMTDGKHVRRHPLVQSSQLVGIMSSMMVYVTILTPTQYQIQQDERMARQMMNDVESSGGDEEEDDDDDDDDEDIMNSLD